MDGEKLIDQLEEFINDTIENFCNEYELSSGEIIIACTRCMGKIIGTSSSPDYDIVKKCIYELLDKQILYYLSLRKGEK